MQPESQAQKRKAFFTDLEEGDPNFAKLQRYATQLDSKIDYAKWKQQLVLQYNYVPLKRIAEKVQAEKVTYLKRIGEEETNCAKVLSSKELTVQLSLFREFKDKLKAKIQEIETEMGQKQIENDVLEAEVKQKRARLKQIMKSNMHIQKQQLRSQGITSGESMAELLRTRSVRTLANSSNTQKNSRAKLEQLHKANKIQKVNVRLSSEESQAKSQVEQSSHSLYRQCLGQLIKSIHSMRSTEDVQSGIFLDIMQRPQERYTTEGKYSLRSNICHTLISRYGSQQAGMARISQRADFDMEWDTFKLLNWKQIMGILLVKDKDCHKIRRLLQLR